MKPIKILKEDFIMGQKLIEGIKTNKGIIIKGALGILGAVAAVAGVIFVTRGNDEALEEGSGVVENTTDEETGTEV
jgi:hypothetical protein